MATSPRASPLRAPSQGLLESTQMKRDFLVVQAPPQVPANFATVPSLAARPVSRIASMDSEVVDPSADTPTSMESMEDADTTPIFPATHKEISDSLSTSPLCLL
ncbi:hypothetical protein B0H11DRAFT_2238355 [Mycena galericulata]|nr:hypothetical protein B0H11DRAFT_2238355 [Mycena galericulata]